VNPCYSGHDAAETIIGERAEHVGKFGLTPLLGEFRQEILAKVSPAAGQLGGVPGLKRGGDGVANKIVMRATLRASSSCFQCEWAAGKGMLEEFLGFVAGSRIGTRLPFDGSPPNDLVLQRTSTNQ